MPGIILIGEPGSGKSTIAEALCQQLAWTRVSFAGPLKDEVAEALTIADEGSDIDFKRIRTEMDDPLTKDFYRGILQWRGGGR